MDGFYAQDTQEVYDCVTRSVYSPSGRVLLEDVSLEQAAAERSAFYYPMRVVGAGALVRAEN